MIGTILVFIGSFLIITWFGTRSRMISKGTWESEGGGGAYLWLAIYVCIVVAGFFV